jgi:signal transduction histidine kinase
MKNIWDKDISLETSMLHYIESEDDRNKAKINFDNALSGNSFNLLEEYGNEKFERHYYKDSYFPLRNEDNKITGIGVIVEELNIENIETGELDHVIKQLEDQVQQRSEDLEATNQNLVIENQKRLNSEQELRVIKKELEEALEKEMELNKLKTKFISMVSHEFRTPLTVIQATLYLIEKSYERQDDEKFAHNLVKIDKSIDNMVNLMENILNLGKLEQGEIKVSNSELNLVAEIKELIESNNKFKKLVTLNLKTDSLKVKSDKLLINQIMNNLLSNSIKYSTNNPEIVLSAFIEGKVCFIVVEDNGIGISKENLSTITEPFKREDKTSSLIKGTGLGLSIIEHNLKLLDGEMQIESEENKGTKITIKIPV